MDSYRKLAEEILVEGKYSPGITIISNALRTTAEKSYNEGFKDAQHTDGQYALGYNKAVKDCIDLVYKKEFFMAENQKVMAAIRRLIKEK